MVPVAIDVDIAGTIEAIDEILVQRGGARATVWELLERQLQALLLAVGNLDRMYYALLGEIEHLFAQAQPSPEGIADVIDQASSYCNDERLLLRLREWQGMIQGAAFSHALGDRRYRDLVSTLRSIDDPLGRYIDRLYRLQDAADSEVSGFSRRAQAGNPPEVPVDGLRWALRTVLALLKLVIAHLTEYGKVGDDLPSPGEACEEAIRNYDRALALALAQLIGRARQDLAMERL